MDALVELARKTLADVSKSFAAASRLLGSEHRDSIVLLYAWCRYCDDTIDGEYLGFRSGEEPGPATVRLEALKGGTVAALAGERVPSEFEALQRVARLHRLPDRYPLELLDGMAMDAHGAVYRTFDDTLKYCYHVAGVVGVMSAIILGVRDRPTLERACDLGIGFQLTNIARDVLADWERGRVYLPAQWLVEAGIEPTNLACPDHRRQLFEVVARLLREADAYYRSASYGIGELSFRSGWAVATARRVYRDIGDRILEIGSPALDTRVVTSKRRKIASGLQGALDVGFLSARRWWKVAPRDGLWTPEPLIA
jgi:phytoene synthase